jgi:hypothetical protein
MMVASRRKKNRAIAEPLHDLESKNAAVKSERALKIRNLQMNVPDSHCRVNRVGRHRFLNSFRKRHQPTPPAKNFRVR